MSAFTRRRTCSVITIGSLAFAGTIALSPVAHAASSSVVISEVFGGGGNSGAPFASDFIELYNRGATTVDLTGWSVQYYSAAGTTAQTTQLSGSIAAGGHFLIKEADGANTAAPALPTPDLVAAKPIPMSATAGRVTVTDPSGAVIDLLGWGTASSYEGTPAGATTNTTSVFRSSACTDTDNNGADFTTGAPTPENSATPIGACTPGTTPPPTGTEATIEQIQGASHTSPLKGQKVINVHGIVTAKNVTGFWMQSATPDNDPATSEAVFVFTRTAPTVTVGDALTVAGTVSEFRPGGATGTTNLTTTEIDSPTVVVDSSGNALPAPVVIGVDRIAPQQTIESGNPGSVESASATFDPATNAIDFDESLEGMRVALNDAQVVGPTNPSYGETPVIPGQAVTAVRSPRGGVVYSGYNAPNAMRLILDESMLPKGSIPLANVGDSYSGQTVGIMGYAFSNFHLMATAVPTKTSGNLTREVTAAPTQTQAAIATFNVENLAPSDPQTKYDRLALQIKNNLQAPDLVGLEEIQDNSGAVSDGTVDSTDTTNKLIAAIKAAGGPSYQATWVNPENNTDGGQPGGNIRQAFLYRTDRGLGFVSKPGATATNSTGVVGTGTSVALTQSPGRIDPTNAALANSRKPLVGQFTWRGNTLFVIANHFNSKGGDDPLFGRFQQPMRSSEAQRHNQATVVRGFVDKLLAANAKANVVVLGDLNDFEFSHTADILVGSGSTALTDLPRTLPVGERYTYVYEGNSQVLDHILLSPGLANVPPAKQANGKGYSYDIVHTNSEFSDQDSDHEPQIVRIDVAAMH